jgi:Ankyrin repeats (many copies)
MATLPAHPSFDHLRRQARDLLRAARAGDGDAVRRLEGASDRLNLSAAQLVVAREYGFASWPRLKAEVAARTLDLAQKAEEFCQASVGDWTGRAARMLAETPELDGFDFATAVVLGDAERVRAELERDPQLATRPDARTGWTALHAVCGSRWNRLDPARADGLLAVARQLLDAGARPETRTAWRPRRGGGKTALRCATGSASAGAGNEPLIRLLLERGAVVEDHDLYLAAFGDDDHRCLRLLLDHTTDLAEIARMLLAAPISTGDVEGARLLLEAGADPRRYHTDDDRPGSAVFEAIAAGCPSELVELLLTHGGDPNAAGPDGRSPYRLATTRGRRDLAELLRRHGANDDATAADRLVLACLEGDRTGMERLLADDPGLHDRLAEVLAEGIVLAAETGNTAAVGLMLDLGLPVDARVGEHGGTTLHPAAYAGSTDTVRLLLDRGAEIEARDGSWNSTPLDWAAVGSGFRPTQNPAADWIATVRTLIETGASTHEITLSPDDPKPPSPEVAQLLRDYGIGNEHPDTSPT